MSYKLGTFRACKMFTTVEVKKVVVKQHQSKGRIKGY